MEQGTDRVNVTCWLNLALSPDFAIKEIEHLSGNESAVAFEREMASIEEIEFDLLEVAAVGMRSGRRKDVIVLAPHNQCRRLMFAK